MGGGVSKHFTDDGVYAIVGEDLQNAALVQSRDTYWLLISSEVGYWPHDVLAGIAIS